MPIVSQEFIDQTSSLLAELQESETEKQSFADDLAASEQENDSLRAQISQMMSDRSMAV